MNKKRKTYVLLVIVIIIWSLVAYQIYNGLKAEPEIEIFKQESTKFSPKKVRVKDTFSIKANYRDPFLGKAVGNSPKTSVQNPSNENVVTDSSTHVSVIYSGMMQSPNAKDRIFFVSLNGNQTLLKVNETIEDIKLLQGNKDQIVISQSGAKMVIKISQ